MAKAQTIYVTPQELKTTASKVRELAGTFQKEYKNVYRYADEMKKWTGKDNTAYITQIKGYENDLQMLYKYITAYADTLEKDATAYQTTQDNIAAQAKKLKN